MRFAFFLFLSIFFTTNCFSQIKCRSANNKLKKVEKNISKGNNQKAIFLLSKIESMCSEPVFLSLIGDIYFSLKNIEKAQMYYTQSYRSSGLEYINSKSLSQFLKSLYAVGNYELFNELINDNNFIMPSNLNSELYSLIEKNTFAYQYKQDSVIFNPTRLDINSKSDDYFPSMPINSDVIIFTARDLKTEFQDEDFFISRKTDDTWTYPVKLGDNINSDYREGSLSVSLDGKDLFFASCNRPDSYGGCDLYYSTLINDTLWSDSYNLGTVINSKFWESQPAISANGKVLFFASNRYGGYGGSDIWMSKKINNLWSNPINLGPEINTSGDEYTPFLHYDNETFYFSSKGHKGFGGFDLYVAQMDSVWKPSNVTNLGYPINTHHDESGLIVSQDGLLAYYNSNINGDLDIYEFNLPYKFKSNSVAVVNGLVLDSISMIGVSCDVIINSADDSWKANVKSDNLGQFSFSVPMESHFSITILSNEHDFFSSNYELKNAEYLRDVQIVLNRLNIGNKMDLNNIYYEFDDFSLTRESLIQIEKFAKYLLLNNKLKIEISGHTDNVGSREYNYTLSKNRAKSVYNALIHFGVNSQQLSYQGYGYDFPISKEDDDESRLKNRRTEIKVIGSSYGK